MRTDKDYLDKAEKIVHNYYNEKATGEETLDQLVKMFKPLWG